MFQRLILVLLLVATLFSCSTTSSSSDDGKSILEQYFQGTLIKRWNRGITILIEEPDPNYFGDLFYLYLGIKYEPIRDRIEKVILRYLDDFDCDFNLALDEISSESDVKLVLDLASRWDVEDLIEFSKVIFTREPSSLKTYELEYLGRSVLSLNQILYIYDTSEKSVQLGAVSTVGYVLEERALLWLVERLLEGDEEISAAAMFALSKHGNAGFDLLADNVENLPLRLKLSSIDLLTFNKVEGILPHYPRLIKNAEPLLVNSILKSFRSFGKKADPYIIDIMKEADKELKLELMNILMERSYTNHLPSLVLLVDDEDIQEYIIELMFEKNARELIKEIIKKKNPVLIKLVVEQAVKHRSDIIFYDEELSFPSLYYFIINISDSDALDYFNKVGFDKNFIEDYKLIKSIFNSLVVARNFENLNGQVAYITRFFELSSNQALAKKEKDKFYSELEKFLETKDKKFLEESINVKNSANPRTKNSEKAMKDFVDTLNEKQKNQLNSYSDAKIRITYDFRKLTYRMKGFGEELIGRYGFKSLIE